MPYDDLREYLTVLERSGKLHRVCKEVDPAWEVAALARVVFQKIPDNKRPALYFENVKGSSIPIVGGGLGASREIYALALETSLDGIADKWTEAQSHPIRPEVVSRGVCQENILLGDEVDVFKFPVPVWTVEHDPGPYLTAPFIVSKDPETGIPNVGTYRVQLKEKNKLGCMVNFLQHLRRHVEMNNALDRPTPVAIVMGTDPTIGLTSVSKVPYGVNEFSVAGGLRGEPVKLVKCITSDLEVPATAEIVIEGEIPPNHLEHEGPFGEYTGYMGPDGGAYVVNVKCITHRHNPVLQVFFSQMPPSESSVIRGFGREAAIYKHLVEDLRLPVEDVRLKESGGSASYLAISIRKEHPTQAREVAWGAWSLDPTFGKFTVVVDSDIDIRDDFALDWALSFRVQPSRDCYIIPDTPSVRLDPSVAPADEPQLTRRRQTASKLFIDATMKHKYPPLAMPPRDHLEKVASSLELYGFKSNG
ncbi:MAG: UbiD family decarboxylase [Bacillota bacterium]